jgi:transcriptional regulator with XRE-family HTH domain
MILSFKKVEVDLVNRVREFRKKKGLTQLDLADITEIYQNDISQIETGGRKVFPGWRKRLSEALEVEEEILFPDEDELK